jgi:hypothetical protein
MPVTADVPEPEPTEDLASTLRYIGTGKLATTRARLANSPETRDFLELGLALLRADLIDHTGPDFELGNRSRLFESVSRERIMALAKEWDSESTRLLSDNMYRGRWMRKDYYTEDLIAYLFRLGPQQRHFNDMLTASSTLISEVSLGQLVRLLAAAEVDAMLADPLVNLQAIVQTALPKHPRVQEYCRAQYELLLPLWARLYERVATAYGLSLKSGRTWDDAALLFNSVVEGALVRARVEGAEPRLSDGEGVLAGAILAMLPSLVVPTKEWDNCYAEQAPGEIDGA